MAKAIAIFNQKGGVGKTTTNVNLSAALAKIGKRVLVIDNDPQGNTSSGLGVDKNNERYSTYDLLLGSVDIRKCIIKDKYKNLDIIPSNQSLAGAEIEMIDFDDREYRLKNAIDQVKEEYDYIFIDCPPSLGMLTINSLVGVDSVIIPIQCEYYALEGVSQLMNTFELVKRSINKNLQVEGVLLSMYDSRTNLSGQVENEVRRHFKSKVFRTVIPRNIRLAEAPSFGLPIIEYDKSSKGARAYLKLAKEFVKRNGV
ncbi:MAG: AAA family ATPase [Firmicutes bacterium]|nr:AAA family ATPase [Bacillota bacterium]